jgi:quinol monooxygenase YgiN
MVIVQGTFRVDPADRDAYLAESVQAMLSSRAERGCLEYVLAADPLEADRVVLSERWESMDDLDEHLRSFESRRRDADSTAEPGVTVLSRDIVIYEVSSTRRLA